MSQFGDSTFFIKTQSRITESTLTESWIIVADSEANARRLAVESAYNDAQVISISVVHDVMKVGQS